MELPADFFSVPGVPFSSEKLRALNRATGSHLPDDYLAFMESYGGGIIAPSYSRLTVESSNSAGIELEATAILGAGEAIDLWENSIELDPAWLYDWAFYFCEASNPPEDKFLMNLSNGDFPVGSILHEDEGSVLQVADDFTSFLSILVSQRDDRPTADETSGKKIGGYYIPRSRPVDFRN